MSISLFIGRAASSTPIGASCKRINETSANFSLTEFADWDAYATFNDSLNESGWGRLNIRANPKSSSKDQMFCMGYIDTAISASRVYEAYKLYREENNAKGAWPKGWENWINQNIEYINKQIQVNPQDPYWIGISLIREQFRGMVNGLREHRPEGEAEIKEVDFWIFQSAGDFEDIDQALNPEKIRRAEPELHAHCTGLLKFAPDYSDIYFAQDTWSDVRELHAYLKSYSFEVKEFKAKNIAISTRTGHLSSVDDFWMADTNLLVLETTLHCFNQTLYRIGVTPNSVLTWMRVYYAMLKSDNGKDWTQNFIFENSGTYNNEYIVLDGNKFTPGQKPVSDLVWMIEQLPTTFHAEDITDKFVEQGWFPSINTPYFEDIFNLADYPGQQQRQPAKKDFWSYYEQPRYKVIVKHVKDNTTYSFFQQLMRWNKYTDPSEPNYGEPAQGILARYDLRPDNGTAFGSKASFAGLDSKTASLKQAMKHFTFDAIASPQYENLPAFSFSNWPGISNYGLVDTWKFPWTTFGASEKTCATFNNSKDCLDMPGCGYCMHTDKCLPALSKDRPAFGCECEDGWKVKIYLQPFAIPMIITCSSLIVVFLIAVYVMAYFYAKKKAAANPNYDSIK